MQTIYHANIFGKRRQVRWQGDQLLVDGEPHNAKPMEFSLLVLKGQKLIRVASLE